METANIELPVYLIGSQFDGGTVEAAFKQFEGRDEFCLSMIDDVKDARGKPDRWQTVKRCVKKAIEAQEDCLSFASPIIFLRHNTIRII